VGEQKFFGERITVMLVTRYSCYPSDVDPRFAVWAARNGPAFALSPTGEDG
jgi:hypothetical protein